MPVSVIQMENGEQLRSNVAFDEIDFPFHRSVKRQLHLKVSPEFITMNHFPLEELLQFADKEIVDEKFIRAAL